MSTPARDRLLAAAMQYFAEHGVGDTSLRSIGDAIGSSHRMLIHHFGSRNGLLAAVVERVDSDLQSTLESLLADTGAEPMDQAWTFWRATADTAEVFGPLFYELMAHAMQGKPHAKSLRSTGVQPWVEPLAQFWIRSGLDLGQARRRARLDGAVARGLLLDLLLTGDRTAVDQAMRDHIDQWERDLTDRPPGH